MTWFLFLVLLGCHRDDPRPDVFLFTVDTMRADRLGAYGYGRDTSPWMDEVAGDGVVFENALSTSSWTVPGASSTLFSAYPWQLAIRESTRAGSDRPVLPAEATSLASVFQQHGYRTLAFVANGHLSAARGYSRGFDVFANVGFVDRDPLHEVIEPHLDGLGKRDEPVFVWVHLFDPHEPYANGGRRAADWSPGIRERLGEPRMDEMLMTGLRADPRFVGGGPGLADLQTFYDGEIGAADEYLRGLAHAMHVGDEDILVLASDHGEEFREHGGLGHHGPLWRETTRVPLIVRAPGLAPARRDEVVSLVDVAPTLVALTGLTPPAVWVGEDVRTTASGPRLLELDHHHAVVDGEWKWVANQGGEHLYRLDDEHRDLAASEPEVTARLRAVWASKDYPVWAPQTGVVDEEKALLEGMGYLHRDP
ncbi:MAG: hypothetical protein EP330_13400 [Deltaproteobacteria bacterium]|nr:MAG: hypothetical protein EP330_13400 [Deltaproteobacteria bacterium]